VPPSLLQDVLVVAAAQGRVTDTAIASAFLPPFLGGHGGDGDGSVYEPDPDAHTLDDINGPYLDSLSFRHCTNAVTDSSEHH